MRARSSTLKWLKRSTLLFLPLVIVSSLLITIRAPQNVEAAAGGSYSFTNNGQTIDSTATNSSSVVAEYQQTAASSNGNTVTYTYTASNNPCSGATIAYTISSKSAILSLPTECESLNQQVGTGLTSGPITVEGTPPTANSAASSSGTSAVDPNPQCTKSFGFDIIQDVSLKWIVCPVINLFESLTNSLDTEIDNLLDLRGTADTNNPCANPGKTALDAVFNGVCVKTAQYPNGQAQFPYQTAWASFRDIALSIVVIAALVMVISQAAGLEILDAYTIRKILPRLLFAAIFITFSWDILQFLVEMSDVVGVGVRSLIYAPFEAGGASSIISVATAQNIPTGTTFVVGLLTVGGALSLGILGLLSLVIGAAISALIAVFVLVFRQVLMTILVITAPFAMACYILPNTHKIWIVWRDTLVSLLMVFPIISAMIASGRVFAFTALAAGGGGTIAGIIAIIAYFAPYFFITKAFKFGAGILGTVHGAIKGAHGGVFNGLGNYRKQQRSSRLTQFKQGELYRNVGAGVAVNSAGRRIGYGVKGRLGIGTQGQAAAMMLENQRIDQTIKNNPQLSELANNKDANLMMFLSGGTSQGLQNAAGYMRSKGVSEDDINSSTAYVNAVGLSKANSMAALKTMTLTKSGAVDAGDWETVKLGIDNLAGGNSEMKNSLTGMATANSRAAGRLDLGGNWLAQENDKTTIDRLSSTSGQTSKDVISHMTMLDGMNHSDVKGLLNGTDKQNTQMFKTLGFYKQYGNDTERLTAAKRTLELHAGLIGGGVSGAEGQQQINNYLNTVLAPQQKNGGTIDEQIAKEFNVQAQDLSQQSRTGGGAYKAGPEPPKQ